MFFVCLLACLLRIGSELFYHLYHELQLPQEVKACASKWKRVKKGPSILLFTPRGIPFHLPCCQQAQPRASFYSLVPYTGTQQLCHQWLSHHLMLSIKDLQGLSQVWHGAVAPSPELLHRISTHNPVPGSLAGHCSVHRNLGKFTANSLCALDKMTHSSPDLAWSPWTIPASQSRGQSEPCRHLLLPFFYDFQSMALVTSLQWKERKISMPAAKIILLLITFPVLYLRPIL